MATTTAGGGAAAHHNDPPVPSSPSRQTAMDDASGSYGHPPAVYTGVDDTHKAHSPAEFNPPPTHLPTGSAVNVHARPMSPTDDGTGSYGAPPSIYVGADDTHKAHRT